MTALEIILGLSLLAFVTFWLWLHAMLWRMTGTVLRLERRIERIEQRFVPPGL